MNALTQHLTAMSEALDIAATERWVSSHVDVAVVCATLYMVFVLWVPEHVMKSRAAYKLRLVNIVWNLALTVFSMIGAYYCVPRLYELVTAPVISGVDVRALLLQRSSQQQQQQSQQYGNTYYKAGGDAADDALPAWPSAALRRNMVVANNTIVGLRGSFDTSVCVWAAPMYRQGIVGLLSFAFMLSKIPEMFDTVLLVLHKKPVIFLHWYHHITVMLYCWYSWMTPTSSGLWFVTMNYCVHSIMYAYYFFCSIGMRRYVRPIAPLITFLQIAQMIIGSVIALYVVYMDQLGGGGCDCNSANARLAVIMYSTYFYFFSAFFVASYLRRPRATASLKAHGRKQA